MVHTVLNANLQYLLRFSGSREFVVSLQSGELQRNYKSSVDVEFSHKQTRGVRGFGMMYKYGQGIFSSIRKGLSTTSDGELKSDMVAVQPKESTIVSRRTSLVTARKRRRDGENIMTPNLVSPNTNEEYDEIENTQEKKRQRHSNRIEQSQSPLFTELPEDVLHHALSFLTDSKDRHSLQLTCSTFRAMSNNSDMMRTLDLGGDPETGSRSILNNMDTPEQAIEVLFEFARAGNLRAMYM